MGMPFNPLFPADGQDPWIGARKAADAALVARVALHETAYVWLDAFTGSDDARLAAAMAYAKTQSRPPTILLSSRSHTFAGTYELYDGFRLVGSLGTVEREFAGNGPQCVVTVTGSALFSVPSTGVKNVWISGVQFRAGSGTVNWLKPTTDFVSGPVIDDGTFRDCAWVGFATVMHARHLRCRIDNTYCNEGTDVQFKLAGSDNYYWQSGGFLSSTKLAASKYYVYFTHMSKSTVGPLFLTPEKATGFRIDGSYGGLRFDGTILDCNGRSAQTACQGAAILVTGGKGLVFNQLWFLGNAVNPAATGRSSVDKGQVYLRGSTSEVLFSGCQFSGGDSQDIHTPAGTPAIYAANGVSGVKVVAPTAPNGGTKLIQHQSAGIITRYAADDWALNVA